MNSHPYLRAYLCGAFVPTLVLPLILVGFITVRLVLGAPFPIERFIIFPMAMVPALFGLWNMLWLASHARTRLPVGLHGAILPFLGVPAGGTVASCLGVVDLSGRGITWFQAVHVPYALFAVIFLAAVIVYYLVWKYLIGFANRVLGIV
jgi:hypothetical protein